MKVVTHNKRPTNPTIVRDDGPGPLPSALARHRCVHRARIATCASPDDDAASSYTQRVVLRRVVTLVAGTALVALGACSASNASPAPTTTVALATTTTQRADDGHLTVGVIAPRGGANADLGTAVRTAVDLAVGDINTAGGVNEHDVTVLQRDEGDNAAATAVAVQDLIQLGVDAIVGPTSSINTLGTLRASVRAGVLTCSPTATAMSLDTFPSDTLFFRTVASDSLQAHAIAHLVEQTGAETAAVVYLDDAYGRPLATEVQRLLDLQGTSIALSMGVDGTEDSLNMAVNAVVEQRPPTVVVVADAATGPGIITAIDSSVGTLRPSFVVNDQLRRPANQSAAFPPDLAHRISGVSPSAFPSEPLLERLRLIAPDTTGLFAANAFDCMNIIALAALSARSADPRVFSASISAVTNNGSTCSSYTACATALTAGRNIDYDGAGGAAALNRRGIVTTATFDVFGFDESGRDVSTGTMTVSST